MKRITQTQKKIAEAHMNANAESGATCAFDVPDTSDELKTREDIVTALKAGRTIQALHQEIAFRYVSITSQLIAAPSTFGHVSEAYKRDYCKGWKNIVNQFKHSLRWCKGRK